MTWTPAFVPSLPDVNFMSRISSALTVYTLNLIVYMLHSLVCQGANYTPIKHPFAKVCAMWSHCMRAKILNEMLFLGQNMTCAIFQFNYPENVDHIPTLPFTSEMTANVKRLFDNVVFQIYLLQGLPTLKPTYSYVSRNTLHYTCMHLCITEIQDTEKALYLKSVERALKII